MKIFHQKKFRQNEGGSDTSRRSEHGMVTLVFIALLAIMLLLVIADGKSLSYLYREIKLLEQKQVKRSDTAQTNEVSVAQSPVKLETK